MNASVCLMNSNPCHLNLDTRVTLTLTSHTHANAPCPTPGARLAHPRVQGRVGVVASRLVRMRAIGLDTAALKSVTLVSPAYLQVLEVPQKQHQVAVQPTRTTVASTGVSVLTRKCKMSKCQKC